MDDQSSQNVVIKTTPGSYFYSDSINLLPNQSLSLNLTALSPTEINDIYEGLFFMDTLVSGQRELVRLFHERNKGGVVSILVVRGLTRALPLSIM